MPGENQVPLELLVEVKDALGRLEEFEKKSAKSIGTVEKTFETMKTVAVAAVAVFAGKQVVDFFKSGIDAAIAQENAMRSLATALDQTGELSDKALKQFGDFANEMEATTKFGDDLVISQVAIAKSFGISNDQAQELVKTAADLAAATGDTLDGAVQKLGKTYAGTTGKLDEMVPALRGLTKAQLANGEAVRVLAERYGGAANDEIKTFSGAILQAENSFGNFQEAVGAVIVDNQAMIATINGLKEVFNFLETAVTDNKEALGDFVTGGLKLAAVAAAGTAEAMATLAEIFTATTGALIDGIGAFAQGAAGLISFVPGAEGAALAMANFGDDTRETAESVTQSLGSVSQGFNAFEATVGAAAQKVFDADMKITESAKKSAGARRDLARASGADAKEVEKLAAAAVAFEATLRQSTGNEFANIQAKLQETLEKISEFESKRTISAQKAEELRVIAVSTSVDKIGKLYQDQRDKQVAAAEEAAAKIKKIAEEQRAAVEAAAANPAGFGVGKLGIQPAGLSPGASQGVGAAAGVLNSALDGAAGAKSLISAGAGAFADAMIPGIGGVVGSIVSKLAEGPEATKAFIREFVAAVPDIVTAIADSMPVVVEALVDSLINKGGIIKIGVALTKAAFGISMWKALGKQLGMSFTGSIDFSVFTKAGQAIYAGIASGFNKLMEFEKKIREALIPRRLLELDTKIRAAFVDGAKHAAKVIYDGILSGAERLKEAAMSIWNAISSAAQRLFEFDQSIRLAFAEAAGKLWEGIKNGVEKIMELPQKVEDAFVNIGTKVWEAFTSVFDFFSSLRITVRTPGWLEDFTDSISDFFDSPAWLDRFQEIIDQLTGAFDTSGAQSEWEKFTSGGTDGDPSTPYARGGMVPAGFPNDSFPARLSSGEMVVPRGDTDRLSGFLDRQGDGSSNAEVVDMLSRILGALDQVGGRPVEVVMDGAVVARSMQRLSYRNARTTR